MSPAGLTTAHENAYTGCRRPSERVDSQLVPRARGQVDPGGLEAPRSVAPPGAGACWGDSSKERALLGRRRLAEHRVTHVAMESTGVYWKPVHNILEGGFTVLVVNAQHLKAARTMLEGLLSEEKNAALLAGLAKGRLRQKREALEAALEGVLRPHHRFLLVELLAQLDYLEEAVERVGVQIQKYTAAFQQEIEQLDTIPGINRTQAETLLAEVGADVSRFHTAAHLSSWAAVCPGNDESAGKRGSGKTRKGSPWLRTALVEAAHGAGHTKNTYLGAQYRRLAARRGKKKALVAVAHSILVITYYVLTRKQPYRDLGANYFDERDRVRVEKRLSRRLERPGYSVTLQPAGATA